MGVFSPIEPARSIGKYALIEEMGEGSLGPVYKGIDQDHGRPVVIRVLCDGIKWDATVEEIFNRECRIAASLQHPNIAQILEIGRAAKSYYIVMEPLGQGTFRSLIEQKSIIPIETKLTLMIQVAEGLSYAHKNGLLHLDIEPGNIHLANNGTIKIRDFAITHILKKYLPHPVVRWGAPIYLCPEQIQQKKCDGRSDIFSTGTVFYELLTYAHPFHHQDSNKALDNILLDSQIHTFEKFPDLPPGIWPIIRKCLARNPDDRYRSMDDLTEECRKLLISLAEDSRLMLAELYASLGPLKKAAAQANASPDTITLLKEAEALLKNGKEADHISLDRIMTKLLEQYPAIQEAAQSLPSMDSLYPSLESELFAGEIQPEPLPVDVPVQRAVVSLPEKGLEIIPESSKPVIEKTRQELPEPKIIASTPPPPENKGINSDAVAQQNQATASPEVKKESQSPIPPASTQPVEQPAPILINRVPVEPVSEIPIPANPAPANQVQVNQIPVNPAPATQTLADLIATQTEATAGTSKPYSFHFPRKMQMRFSPRNIIILLSLLVIAAAVYIFLGSTTAASAWNFCRPLPSRIWKAFTSHAGPSENKPAISENNKEEIHRKSDTMLKEARLLLAGNQFEESRVVIRKVLENDPEYAAAIDALEEVTALEYASIKSADQELQKGVARVSSLIESGKLDAAKSELDKLQEAYPDASIVDSLQRRWLNRNAYEIQESARKAEEAKRAELAMREDQWNKHVSDLFARGKYNDAGNSINDWLAEKPESTRGQEFNSKLQGVQRNLKIYSSAIAENRYAEAIGALNNAEALSPSDSNLVELRHQVEAKNSDARSYLTVHRLGPKANLLLDGKPFGKDGEAQNESIPIGNHTIALENKGGLVTSRVQEYPEGQRVLLVYDLGKQMIRPMTDADRDLLAKRKAMEEVQQFPLEHDHGAFRGSCRGVLSLDYLDLSYSPTEGDHGFRVPFKLLRLKLSGKTAHFSYVADNSRFNSFKFKTEEEAERFKQRWGELRALVW
jgi:serine/threonine protein kinase/tetratricopeptide (TPR) repeat protein